MRIKFRRELPAQMREVTKNRLRHAQRAIERQKAKLALFVDQVEFESPEERLERIDTDRYWFWVNMRNMKAAQWRRGRAWLRALPEGLRDEFIAWWNQSWLGPKEAAYFCDLLRHFYLKHGLGEPPASPAVTTEPCQPESPVA